MADNAPKPGKELTGRKVLAITVAFFAVIISVNVYMATMAVGTFPGLEVKNSYVASQSFNADRVAQEALGWDVSAEISGTKLMLSILGPDGLPARVEKVEATLGRATQRTDDQTPDFSITSTGLRVAEIGALAPGKWDLRLDATAANGTHFRQRLVLYVSGS